MLETITYGARHLGLGVGLVSVCRIVYRLSVKIALLYWLLLFDGVIDDFSGRMN